MAGAEFIDRLSRADLTAREMRAALVLAREGRPMTTAELMAELGIRDRGDLSRVTARLREQGLVTTRGTTGPSQALHCLADDGDNTIIPVDGENTSATASVDGRTTINPEDDGETTNTAKPVDGEMTINPDVVDGENTSTEASVDGKTTINPSIRPPDGSPDGFPLASPFPSPSLPPGVEEITTTTTPTFPPISPQGPSEPEAGCGGKVSPVDHKRHQGLFESAREVVRSDVVNDKTLSKRLTEWVQHYGFAAVDAMIEKAKVTEVRNFFQWGLDELRRTRDKEVNGGGASSSSRRVRSAL